MEYTGDGARNTDGAPPDSGANGTPDAGGTVDRSARNTERTTEHITEHGAHHGTVRDGAPATATEHQPVHLRPGAFRAWRNRKRENAERSAEQRTAARQVRDAQRNADRQSAERARSEARTAAVHTRRGGRAAPERRDADALAPVPRWMRILGVWIGRTFGALPLIAPLVVSGSFTFAAFASEPLKANPVLAGIVTLALEGGLYKLVTLESKTLLAGDSTIKIRMSITLWIAIISSVIFAHAVVVAATDKGLDLDKLQFGDLGWSWAPAVVSAAFSILGVSIYRHEANYEHRVALRAAGRIDNQAPKFALLSWLVCPWETPWAFRHAIKYRLDRPLDAINDYRYWKAADKPALWPDPAEVAAAGDLDPVELIRRIGVAAPVLARGIALRYADVLQDAATDGTLAEYAAPSTLLRMERELGGAVRTGARSLGPAPVSAPPAPPTGAPARSTERYAERNGTRSGTGDGAEQHAVGDGAPGPGGHGARNVPERTGTDGAPVQYLSHVLDITDAFKDWRTQLPSIRKAAAAIDVASRARGGSFNSMSQATDVIKYLRTVQGDPEFARTLEVLRAENRPK